MSYLFVREEMAERGGEAAPFEGADAGVKREAEGGEISDAAKRQMLQPAEPSSEGGRPPSPAGAGGAGRTPGGWEEFVSARTGKVYWYSATSLKTTWDRPGGARMLDVVGVKREAEGVELPDAAKRQMLQPAEPSSAAGGPPSPAGAGGAGRTPLPGGWEEFVSARTGRAYWYNSTSLKTSWDRPGGVRRSPSPTALDGRVEELQQLLADGLHLSSRLYQASTRGDGAMVKRLLDKGTDVEAKAEDGDSPLHRAAHGGHGAIVRMLLDAGARVDVRTNAQYSPLHLAPLHIEACHGDTPLHLAAQGCHVATVQLLLDNGAGVNVTTNFGFTPLHRALGPQWGQQAGLGRGDVVRLLLNRGAAPHARTRCGKTPWDLARACGHGQVAELLRAAMRKAECEAFAMGHLQRLGARSLVQGLDAGVVRLILDPA